MAYDPTAWDPTGRFTGLASTYASHRPDYPDAAIDFILSQCGLEPGALLVDVGCGTGISSRQLAGRGLRVIGIEPNEDMRHTAEAFDSTSNQFHDPSLAVGVAVKQSASTPPSPDYRAGSAEATSLPDASTDAVLAAQAFHWFDPAPTLREFHRILKPAGWVVLMWNERDESDPFTAAFGDVVRSAKDAAALETPRPRSGDALLHSPLFRHGQRARFQHEQPLDEGGLLGRAFSMSYSPRGPEEAERFAAQLRQVFARFQNGRRVVLRYETSVTVGQK